MLNVLKVTIAFFVAIVIAVIKFNLEMGPLAAIASVLGYWTYLFQIGIGFLFVVLILQVVLPTDYRWARDFPPWARTLLVRIRRLCMPNISKLKETRIWKLVEGRGAFIGIFIWTWVLSPLAGAWWARYMKLSNKRAWGFSLWAVVLSTAINVSYALGLADYVKNLFL